MALGFLGGRPLAELKPQWLHREGMNVDVGLTFDCPRCAAIPNPREHRLVMWFVSHEGRREDMTIGHAVRRLFDFAGTRWHELTLWAEWPPPRDPLLELDHWRGYVERGTVYDGFSWGAI